MRRLRATVGTVAVLLCAAPTFAADPVTPEPATHSSFQEAMDRSVDPCVDFYQFACGSWVKANPVPPDQSSWGRFNELAERNRETLKAILEKAAEGAAGRTPAEQKIGDFYGSCMDEAAANKLGVSAIRPELDRVAGLTSKNGLADLIAGLHDVGVGALFNFGSDQDFKDPKSVIASFDQGGLGLPDRDYYFKDDPKSMKLREEYVAHVMQMFGLLGETPHAAAADAKAVMDIETALAKASLGKVERRDPKNLDHKMTVGELVSLDPSFDWKLYIKGRQAPPVESLNVAVPGFVKGMEAEIQSASLDQWKAYLRWHVVHDAAALLSTPFVDADFAFYGKTLSGAREQKARWKRCSQLTDDLLGEALGKKYVEETFGADGKARMSKMVAALEAAMGTDLRDIPWMTEATKKEALGKLGAIANKIGYPDKWRDYSSVRIARGDLVGNARRAAAFEQKRQLDKIGRPLDRGEWLMTPPTVNAYYNPQMNDINFPAGVLQPPFFDRQMDDAVNFGAIGSVIGHEMTHGFDDQGRQFAADGSLSDWWTEADAKEFEKRAACIVDQYGGYTAVDDVKLNGKLTLGENIADSGGARIAYMALMQTLTDAAKAEKPDGLTPQQRFFVGWGQMWCNNMTPERARLLAQVDPHSPGRYRTNGVVSNMPEFREAFGCQADAPMVRENACRVW